MLSRDPIYALNAIGGLIRCVYAVNTLSTRYTMFEIFGVGPAEYDDDAETQDSLAVLAAIGHGCGRDCVHDCGCGYRRSFYRRYCAPPTLL